MVYTVDMEGNILSVWLVNKIKDRGWSIRELARRAGVSHTSVAKAVSGETRPSPGVCLGIAYAFGELPEDVLRLAGHLPPLPSAVAEEHEAVRILRSLPQAERSTVMRMLRGLSDSLPSPQSSRWGEKAAELFEGMETEQECTELLAGEIQERKGKKERVSD
jgi:transcriptional regulator with XRE-family HTH domain